MLLILQNLKILSFKNLNFLSYLQLSIGLYWNADTFYNNDTKKYELENVK